MDDTDDEKKKKEEERDAEASEEEGQTEKASTVLDRAKKAGKDSGANANGPKVRRMPPS